MSPWRQIASTVAAEFSDLDAASATRVILRLLLAAAVGAMLGFERESKGKSAGIRTHMLVALGSALLILAPSEAGADQAAVSRVIQGLVAGIGFLGAGAIVKHQEGEVVEGLTTAATIWMTAALGITAGLGRGLTAVFSAVVSLIILRLLPGSGPNDPHRRRPHDADESGEPSP